MSSRHGHTEHVIGHYARLAADFWRGAVNEYVVDAAQVGPGEVMLDIGAGAGPATVPAARRGATVVAVDPSRVMRCALHLRRLWQRRRHWIRIAAGTAERLPLEDHSVDVAVAVNTMHHWTDMDLAARELHRVLRPGGRLVLVDEDFDDPAHVMASRAASHNATYPMIDPDVVAEKLAAAGFATHATRPRIAGRPLLQVTGMSTPGRS